MLPITDMFIQRITGVTTTSPNGKTLRAMQQN